MQHFTFATVNKEVMNPNIWRQVIFGERITFSHIVFTKGAVVPTHQHESEQITYITEGALQFQLEGQEITVHKGEVLVIPSNVPHSALALEDTDDLEIFSPIRIDWLAGKDHYLRQK